MVITVDDEKISSVSGVVALYNHAQKRLLLVLGVKVPIHRVKRVSRNW